MAKENLERNPFQKIKKTPTDSTKINPKSKKTKTKKSKNKLDSSTKASKIKVQDVCLQGLSSQEQLKFFIDKYQSANQIQLSSLEIESIKDSCILQLPESSSQDDGPLVEALKPAFKPASYKKVLCEKQIPQGKNIQPGSPAVLLISLSALRSLELLKKLKPFTKDCPPAKLFSKHMKVDEQVAFLKNRVNIASGTPNRIKKLIDMEALGLSRLAVIVVDMYTDVKGYSLLTLPQVRDEFWDLYKTCFHQLLVNNNIRLCFYAPT
jgi:hypothetical protein